MDISGLTLPTSDISSEVHCCGTILFLVGINGKTPVVSRKYHFIAFQFMANCYYKGKEVRSRSDRDREVKLS